MYGQNEWSSNQQHFFAPIIMYTKLVNTMSQEDARKMLHIPSDHFVYMVLGTIRNKEEKKLLERVARSLSNKEILHVAQWPFYGTKPILNTVRRFYQKIQFPKHIFKAADTIPVEQMQVYLNAADVLIIPRIHSLNSGLISLAFSFKKTVLGPSSGNIGPILAKSGNAIFDINNLINLVEHLEYAKKLAHQGQGIHNFNYATEHWSWEKVGQLHIDAYTKLLSN